MIDGIPVVDAVVHAYDFHPSNYRNDSGKRIAEAAYRFTQTAAIPEVASRVPDRSGFFRDWSIEETARMLFLESDTDIAVHHALPLFHAFHDGGASFKKTVEAKERWPHRFIAYAGVDPLERERALDELDRQAEILDPVGVKLYPHSWVGNELQDWAMDDPEVAYPIFERASALGIRVVAVHKAIPLGPVPLAPYRVDDVDRAAIDFPDLAFEVVHGGMAFLEESAWQLARFSNIYVNLEVTSSLLARRPQTFARAISTLLQYGGAVSMDKIMWGTGAMSFHPQQNIQRFLRDFEFTEDVLQLAGIDQLTIEDKKKILAGNYARMAGIDLSQRLLEIQEDEFAAARRTHGLFDAYSSTNDVLA